MSDQQPGGSPAAPTPPGGAPAPRRSRTGVVVVSIVAALALIAAVTAVVLLVSNSSSSADEVFLEAADQPGPDPFTTSVPVAALPSTTTTTAAPTTTAGGNAVASRTGSQPGLYGGTQNNASCDPEQLVSFLESHPDKASAWVQALNTDPALRWSGGNQVQVSQIRAFVDELTPVNLTVDTRVTNYGFKNGQPTPRQAVLQRGTAVLVDAYGVPRAKCGCGNPLTRPVPAKSVTYTGPQWTGWSPTTIVVVQQTTVVIDVFVIVDLAGGGYIDRPAGTTGDQDSPSSYTGDGTVATTSTTSTTTTTSPPSTLAPKEFCAEFEQIQAKWANYDADPTAAAYQELADDLNTLAAAAPAEIAGDMATFNAWAQSALRAGDVFTDMPADVEAASNNVEAYINNVCGISTG